MFEPAPQAAASGAARPITEVAVGVLLAADGRFLLAQRPAGKPYAGYWEFPGGKLEAGESVGAALARELHEELGIVVAFSEPWRTIEHDYPHAYVRLHFCRVTAWEGEPSGREGQALAWQSLPVAVGPLLPATLPALAWLGAASAAAESGQVERLCTAARQTGTRQIDQDSVSS